MLLLKLLLLPILLTMHLLHLHLVLVPTTHLRHHTNFLQLIVLKLLVLGVHHIA